MSQKNLIYTAGVSLAVVLLVQKYGNRVGMRHGS